MPIINGKYKNPGWLNNQSPPISAENLNDISETLETLDAQGNNGKRYASVVVGTSTNGWTATDCDYLCDGADDQIEIQAAIDSLYSRKGGEVLLLAGVYNLSGPIQTTDSATLYPIYTCIRGSGDRSTVLKRTGGTGSFPNQSNYMIGLTPYSSLRDIGINGGDTPLGSGETRYEVVALEESSIQNCYFFGSKGSAIICDKPVNGTVDISYNMFRGNARDILISGSANISHNMFLEGGLIESKPAAENITIIGNVFVTSVVMTGGTIKLEGLKSGSIIGQNSMIAQISILNTTQTSLLRQGKKCLIIGNTFTDATTPAVILGPSTANNFVTGNLFTSNSGTDYIQDSGENNVVRWNNNDDISNAPNSVLVSLPSAGWSSGGTQTVSVQGVSANEADQLITPTPTSGSQAAYYAAGVRATAQTTNSITFTADTVPTANLSVYVVIQEVA